LSPLVMQSALYAALSDLVCIINSGFSRKVDPLGLSKGGISKGGLCLMSAFGAAMSLSCQVYDYNAMSTADIVKAAAPDVVLDLVGGVEVRSHETDHHISMMSAQGESGDEGLESALSSYELPTELSSRVLPCQIWRGASSVLPASARFVTATGDVVSARLVMSCTSTGGLTAGDYPPHLFVCRVAWAGCGGAGDPRHHPGCGGWDDRQEGQVRGRRGVPLQLHHGKWVRGLVWLTRV
jgi:hypothetical protein